MFNDIISAELAAQTRYDPKTPDPLKNPSYIAKIITARYAIQMAPLPSSPYQPLPTNQDSQPIYDDFRMENRQEHSQRAHTARNVK